MPFLRAASETILRHTGADALELWINTGRLRYRWSARTDDPPAHPLQSLPPMGAGDPAAQLLTRALETAGLDAASARVLRTPAGSVVCRERDAPPGEPASVVFVPFEIEGPAAGVLQLGSRRAGFFADERVEHCEGLAHVLGVAFANRLTQIALTERVKELTCMYRIAQVAAESERSLDETVQAVVDLLPPAWQYPAITTARITIGDRTYQSSSFREGPYRLAAEVLVHGETAGRLEVFYTDRFPNGDDSELLDEAPFLAEERHLIDGVARELAFILERKQAEEDRTRLESQVRRADRLATIGQLTAGVAHELNEPLANILGFAQLAAKQPNLPEQVDRDIARIVTASLYAREVVRKLMLFSRQTPAKRSAIQLEQVVEDALALLAPRCAKEGVEVIWSRTDPAPPILGDAAQLQQVVVNLMVNSVQAMPGGGTVTITIDVLPDCVRLALTDDGVGMSSKVAERAFVPFFTTKDVGQGTGLGLSVVHGIVTAHGGSVALESEEGRGTRFEVRLPRGQDEVTE